ncbi:hypothetical protein [Halobacterium zhouii]|uniref:hypothetical protein n=1 Tax=Halobacterium zhouii TaxID=2902624 RepID=UPI001E3E00F5|nr:hypothetical protein [Halobacterium zhouii]
MTPSFAESVRVVVLLAIALGMLYPVVTYSHRVMHTHAIYSGTLTICLLAASVVVQVVRGPGIASETMQVGVTAGVLGTSWLFARGHISRDEASTLDVELEAAGEGFESAPRGGNDE